MRKAKMAVASAGRLLVGDSACSANDRFTTV